MVDGALEEEATCDRKYPMNNRGFLRTLLLGDFLQTAVERQTGKQEEHFGDGV